MTPLAAYVLLFLAVGAAFILVNLLAGKLIRPARPEAEKGTIYECGEPTIGSSWIQFDLRFYVVALLFVIFDVEVAFFFPWAEVFGKANAVATAGSLTDAEAYHQTGERVMELVPAFEPRFTAEQAARFRELLAKHQRKEALTPEEQADQRSLSGFTYAAMAERLKAVTPEQVVRLRELREKKPLGADERNQLLELEEVARQAADTQKQARGLSWMAFWEILVFFGVLLVGFAYLWRRGDLAWVRSLSDRPATVPAPVPAPPPPQPAAERELVGAGSRSAVP